MEITANITEVEQKYIPVAVSMLPDVIEIEPGDTIDFTVFLRTEWNESLHNVSISFCKEFDFKIDPLRQAIADSWPNNMDDSAARQEWGWEPEYNLESMTRDMIERLSQKLGKEAD